MQIFPIFIVLSVLDLRDQREQPRYVVTWAGAVLLLLPTSDDHPSSRPHTAPYLSPPTTPSSSNYHHQDTPHGVPPGPLYGACLRIKSTGIREPPGSVGPPQAATDCAGAREAQNVICLS